MHLCSTGARSILIVYDCIRAATAASWLSQCMEVAYSEFTVAADWASMCSSCHKNTAHWKTKKETSMGSMQEYLSWSGFFFEVLAFPLASTIGVWLTLSSLCLLFQALPSINLSSIKVAPSIKPGTAGWEASLLPVCYAASSDLVSLVVVGLRITHTCTIHDIQQPIEVWMLHFTLLSYQHYLFLFTLPGFPKRLC